MSEVAGELGGQDRREKAGRQRARARVRALTFPKQKGIFRYYRSMHLHRYRIFTYMYIHMYLCICIYLYINLCAHGDVDMHFIDIWHLYTWCPRPRSVRT